MTVEEIKEQMCDEYCRFCRDKNLDEVELADICVNCPLERLDEAINTI